MSTAYLFLNKTQEEAKQLLNTSREYVKWQIPAEAKNLTMEDHSRISRETMRIARRLSQITAWLLVQQAVHRQEISLEQACSKEYEVLKKRTCLFGDAEEDHLLPRRLRDLLKESRELYLRILRLDEAFRRQHSQGA